MKLLQVMLVGTILCYVAIGFVRWEFDWLKHLATTSSINRLWFFLGILAKTGIEYAIYKYMLEKPNRQAIQKKLNEEAQSYIYDDEGNVKQG